MGDYDVYLRAAGRLVEGEAVYRLSDPHRYLYAPIFPFLFVPLVPVPAVVGKLVWYVANLALAAAILRRSLSLAVAGGRAPPGLLLLVLVFSLRFIDNNIAHGQMNLLLLWLVLEAYALAGRDRFALAGLALAAAIATKVFPLVLLLQLALRRQGRFLVATIGGGLVLLALPGLWWQGEYPAVLRSWLAVVIDQATHYEMGNKINQSISAFAYRLFRPHPGGEPLTVLPPGAVGALAGVVHLAFLVPLAAVSWRLGREPGVAPEGPRGGELSLYLLYATVLSPYSWKYYFVNLIPPLALALGWLWRPHRRWLDAGLVAVFVLNALPGMKLLGKPLALAFQLGSFHFLAVAALFAIVLAILPGSFRTEGRGGFTTRGGLC